MAGGRAEPGADSFTTWAGVNWIVDHWINNEFNVFIPFDRVPVNHPVSIMIISFPFAIIPLYSENLIFWNVFYGVLSAAAVLGISRLEGLRISESGTAFRLVLFNPFVWIANPIWRNTMEQTVFALSLLALLISGRRSPIASLCCLLIFAPISYFYRSQYAIVYLIALAYQYAFRNQEHHWWSSALIIGFLTLILFAGEAPVQNLVFDPVRHYILESGPSRFDKGITSIPYRLFFGLLTPFPWTNTLDAISPYHLARGIADHIMSVFGVAIFSLAMVETVFDLKRGLFPPTSVAFGLASVLSGCSWSAIHNVYVHVGMIFLLPYALKKGSKRLFISFFITLYALILGNGLWLVIR